jgi:hypothetical protein
MIGFTLRAPKNFSKGGYLMRKALVLILSVMAIIGLLLLVSCEKPTTPEKPAPEETGGYGEETGGYGEDTGGYGEETGGYGEETGGYGE